MLTLSLAASLCLLAPPERVVREVRGWTVHIDKRLLADQPKKLDTALALLNKQLAEVRRVIPEQALTKLFETPLWITREYPGVRPGAEYHPNVEWLKENGRDPAMAKGVEFTNVRIFDAEYRRMPNFVLHELAHAYHDRVLGFDSPEVREAYDRAKRSKIYEKVERSFGGGRPNVTERSYAMTDSMEFFAESSEAYFSRNDFYPFTRKDLVKHDPETAALIDRLWNSPTNVKP